MPMRVRHFIDFVAERAPQRLAGQHAALA